MNNKTYNELIEIFTKTQNQESAMRILHSVKNKCLDLQSHENNSIVNIKSFKYNSEKSVLKICIFVKATNDQMFEIYNDLWSFWLNYSMLPPMFLNPNDDYFLKQMETYTQNTDK